MLTPVKTFFNKSAMASNLLTMADYRVLARALGLRTWRQALLQYANQKGGALLVRADGRLTSYTVRITKKTGTRTISEKTYQPSAWGWE